MRESILAGITVLALFAIIFVAVEKYLTGSGKTEKIIYWLRLKKDCKHCCIVCEYYDICRDMERGKE